jgi:ABC-type hemin transport system substrate-binding protein
MEFHIMDAQQAQQLKDTLDRIAQAKHNPEQIQQLVTDAKAKVEQFAQAGQTRQQPPR